MTSNASERSQRENVSGLMLRGRTVRATVGFAGVVALLGSLVGAFGDSTNAQEVPDNDATAIIVASNYGSDSENLNALCLSLIHI